MLSTNIPKEFKKYSRNCQHLKKILKDTNNALDNISVNLQLGRKYLNIITVANT